MDDNTRDPMRNRYNTGYTTGYNTGYDTYGADRYRRGAMQDSYDEEGNTFTSFISEHPVSAALIGAGVGLLIAGSVGATRSGSDSSAYGGDSYNNLASRAQNLNEGAQGTAGQRQEEARDKAGKYTQRLRESAQHVRGRAQDYAQEYTQKTKGGLGHIVEEYPLAVGAVAALVGAAIGFMAPSSRVENRVLGGTRDTLMEQAQERFRDVRQVAEEAVSEAKNTLQEEAEKRGLTPEKAKSAAQQVIQDGREAAQKAADRAKSTAQEAMKEGKEAANKSADNTKDKAKQEADKRNLSS
jgi:ElaB/YqjD/DUF883 family membrane-anchored ribosome-binding protein